MTRFTSHVRQTAPNASPWTFRTRLGILAWDYCWLLLCAWTPKPANRWRLLVLALFGARIEGRPFVHQRARIQIPWNVTLRHRATIGDRANLYSLGEIEVGEHATIAQECYLCTGTHDFDDLSLRLVTGRIEVGAETFVGARTFVMPGIRIGRNALIGACSVVTRDVADNVVIAGNPAHPTGRLRPERT